MIFKDLSDESIVKLLTPSSRVLNAVNGTLIYPMGKYYAKCRFVKSRWLSCKFYVVSTEGPAICSCSDSIGLGIITVAKSDLISNYSKHVAQLDALVRSKCQSEVVMPSTDVPLTNQQSYDSLNLGSAGSAKTHETDDTSKMMVLVSIAPML